MGQNHNKIKNKKTVYSKTSKSVTVDDFDLLKVIGRGNFGKVLLVQEKGTQNIYAMKVLKKNEIVKRKQVKHVLTERALMIKLDCPFIVDFHYSFQNKEKLYFVMEYVSGGDIYHRLNVDRRFSEKRVLLYSAAMIIALQKIHEHGAIYRDMKPENLLIDNKGYLKLIDFGLAKIFRSKKKRKCKTRCGTPEYVAPEVIKGEKYGIEADYWSLGIVLFEMLHGMPPFYAESTYEIYEKVLNDEPKIASFLSSEVQDLLTQLLKKEPKERLGSPNRKNIREHDFFCNLDWQKIYSKQYKPEFVPEIEGKTDIKYIDETFTKEPAIDSFVDKKLIISSLEQSKFDGFAFVSKSNLVKDMIFSTENN
ncbi:ribosomal protein S6 KINASE [Anaeramoeba flamelloides]|uniref:non-specific serine/threonine protein kinase n=1 Tax=Anaeramoeba flamelloides TaxID=1746091 RepID=A0AAV7Y5H4_9EUKA|nr:ribosomal protein S6 KINASE [Anaeramoeba flamelloides]